MLEGIKKDFPVLNQIVNDEPLVYLDNAATTQKPLKVLAAIKDYYENDISQLYEPIKEMLQDIMIKDNEEDIKEEALHLLEAYTDAPYEIFEENINRIPQQYLSDVKALIKKGEA